MKRNHRILLVFFILSLNTVTFSQHTSVYNQPEHDYQTAMELYSKQKYNLAKALFLQISSTVSDPKSELKAGCNFYAALCACEMYNNDAPALLTSFINQFPENAHIQQAYFALGKYYFFRQQYKLSLKNFLHVNSGELSETDKAEYNFKSAYAAFMENELSTAKLNFNEIKDKDSKYTGPATYYYAHILYKEKKYESALKSFEKLKKDETFGPIVPYYIAQILYLQGKYQDLIEISQNLLSASAPKRSAEISRFIFESYFHLTKFREAIPYMNGYIEKTANPISREDKYVLGYSYYKISEFNKATPYLSEVASLGDSLSQNAMFFLSDVYIKSNRKKEALTVLAAASKLNFDRELQEEALYNYAKLSFELSYNPYNEAIKALQNYLTTYPDSKKKDEMFEFLVEIYASTKNFKEALKSIENISKLSSKLQGIYQKLLFSRGVELFNNQNYPEAFGLFNKAISNNFDPSYTALSLFWEADAFDRLNQFDSAQSCLNSFYTIPGVTKLKEYPLSFYNMGYVQFKKKEYAAATFSFKKYIETSDNKDKKVFNDALLRLADCHFVNKEYSRAIEQYDNVIHANISDLDYAIFQKAISLGVLGKLDAKTDQLELLIQKHPSSSYLDDAIYELGNTYFTLKNDAKALLSFKQIINQHANSYYHKYALLKSGLILYNIHQDEQALAMFKKVSELYPGSPESKEALMNIKNIYVDQNKVDEFFQYVKGLSFANVSEMEQDSITYTAAETRYMNNDCESAISSFTHYLDKFPKGAFSTHANFYMADCQMRTGKLEDAVKGLELVINAPPSKFSSRALQKAANLNFTLKKYENAYNQFDALEKNPEFLLNISESETGKMRCAFILKKYTDAINCSGKLILQDKLTPELKSEAHLTIAKSAYYMDSINLALTEFEITSKIAQNEAAAESKYYLASIYFNQGNLEKSEKIIFDFISQSPSYEELLAKNFMLLSDIYVKKDNLFQAKQTLQSIIDNYEGAEIVKMARDKLSLILETEKARNEKKNDIKSQFGTEE